MTITNEKSVSTVLSSIGRNLLKTDVTWGKIVSLYCVAGGLAIDCVQQGHPEYLYGIVETMGFVIERDAATWIAQQGGWVSRIELTFFRQMVNVKLQKKRRRFFSVTGSNAITFSTA